MRSEAGPSSSAAAAGPVPGPSNHGSMLFSPSSSDPADLPPMPVPYEDFHFSLDLPTDLDMSDLQFLSGATDRKGGPSNPMTPGLTAAFLASTPHGFHGLEDIHMSSRAGSRRGSFSNKSRPQSPRVGALGLGNMTKLPDFTMRPPPPPDFEPPPGSNLFSPAASPFGLFAGASSPTKGKHDSSETQPPQPPPSQPNGALFDANERNMLSSFLEGFEWEFDPTLPEGMPSFAAAAAERAGSAADAFGLSLDGRGSVFGGRQRGDNHLPAGSVSGSASGSGSATASSQSPHDSSSTATSPPTSKRGNKRNKHNRDADATAKPMSQETDLVNAAFGGLPDWTDDHGGESAEAAQIGSKRGPPGHHHARDRDGRPNPAPAHGLGDQDQHAPRQPTPNGLDLNNLTGVHAEMFSMSAGLDTASVAAQPKSGGKAPKQAKASSSSSSAAAAAAASSASGSSGKKMKIEHDDAAAGEALANDGGSGSAGVSASASGSKRELLTESEKRQNHILSEQRRRNYIREGFKELVVLLDDGRSLGARALGLSSGFGTGVEDEGLDDRTDVEGGEDDILAVGRKKPPKKAKKAGPNGARARGKGRGRGGSAGAARQQERRPVPGRRPDPAPA
ncbi:uncharacterized protein PFL1_03254 [Pseudozyma flocculosa PF-1]|uniref:BHLH domain-containing protein n=1 Tax=Pseudozyma flocculosa PF-1 TaxID=1277687 RepID=A0A061H925_9BASI|nr:uncharacterized protein PFL1_03254 [Pseudozyma flocculosa PF-1]EPQ28964.1 hypothetical protein PFL1_03254 [Pseudozyma flocculosa PF-1]